MRYGPLFPYAGARPLQEYFPGSSDVGGGVSGVTASGYQGPGSITTFMPNGAIVPGFDNYWGGVEFQYCYFGSTVPAWTPVTITPSNAVSNFSNKFVFVAAAVANSANQARPMGVSIAPMVAGQFGWVAVSGLVPALSTASVAAGSTTGITGAGTLGASSAGKEIENAVVILPATTTIVKPNATLLSGSAIIQFTGNNSVDGLFLGAALSGTGIPSGAVVGAIDADGRRITMNAGPGVTGTLALATQSGGVSVTGTYNDGTNYYNILQLNRPFCQGRIT